MNPLPTSVTQLPRHVTASTAALAQSPLPVIAVVGLGYVGLPLALAFATLGRTLGIDIATEKLAAYRQGIDPTGLVPARSFELARHLEFAADARLVEQADVVIIAVPTPVDEAGRPNLTALASACENVGKHLRSGATVIFESTVFPGATEELCVPLLEAASGMHWRKDFFVAFSPERINPGDRVNTLQTIRKLVAGDTPETLERVAALYEAIIPAGVHRMSSLRSAETAKIVENAQRDINVAFANEVAIICHAQGIDTLDVLEACGTKWNFLPFRPGLVGGECVAIASHLLAHVGEKNGHMSRLLAAVRRTNEGMAAFIASETARTLANAGRDIQASRVTVLGITFKEDVPDLRNTKVVDIVRELHALGASVEVHDPVASAADAMRAHGIGLVDWDALPRADAIIVAVGHQSFRTLNVEALLEKLAPGGAVIDVKGALDVAAMRALGIPTWRL